MINVTVDVESLILQIEKCKTAAYESLCYANQDDPTIFTHTLAKAQGIQAAYDDVIAHLRRLQGCDKE